MNGHRMPLDGNVVKNCGRRRPDYALPLANTSRNFGMK